MRFLLSPVALLIAGALAAAPAAANPTPPPSHGMTNMMMMMEHHMTSVSVQGTGEVEYTPDQAHITLGVNGEAPGAAAAASDIAGRANAVIAALKSLGIGDSAITTSGYTLYYRQATDAVKAAFVASETIGVKMPIDKAGAAIDAGIRAGANQTYGLTYDTTQRDALYKQAVQRAVVQAHDLADVAATAAGVKLGSVMTITLGGSMPMQPYMPVARLATMAVAAPPPIAPGTGTMSATVLVTYSIASPMHM
ncbi:MAG TPA: SIMPL domain-containing protein [Magnetospirillaceae bacterium]|nr:SIMPL domain-containing protein [Magnetospirillaceae bacterium]